MSTIYFCKRCNYETNYYKDILRHFLRKNKCKKNLESYNYSDDQILILSLLPYINNIHIVQDCEIEHLKESSLLYNNINELINLIIDIDKNKLKTCKYCNIEFDKILDLRKHILLHCFYKILENRINLQNQLNTQKALLEGDYNILNSHNLNFNNSQITTNSNNNNNITNHIYLDINNNPVPFDDNWDISNFDTTKKIGIIFNKLMYTGLLEELMKNEKNLNVIIDKETQSGMVYKNDHEKYIEMKSKDIVSNTMEKLKNQLLDINNETKDMVFKDNNDYNRRMITKKYIDYTKDTNIQEQVFDYISNVYDKNKEKALKVSKNVSKNKPKPVNGF
jgi:hypothetical protein